MGLDTPTREEGKLLRIEDRPEPTFLPHPKPEKLQPTPQLKPLQSKEMRSDFPEQGTEAQEPRLVPDLLHHCFWPRARASPSICPQPSPLLYRETEVTQSAGWKVCCLASTCPFSFTWPETLSSMAPLVYELEPGIPL